MMNLASIYAPLMYGMFLADLLKSIYNENYCFSIFNLNEIMIL
uniref:Uncharacterized protein n=1 Tax=Rhizophora mucronata TaxID=61149 RepID=A0A2P2QTQ8_RHIMU